MQTIVIYSSQTGNTRKLATQIFAAIPGDSKDLKNIDEYREKDAELYFVGFWVDRGDCDEKTVELLSGLHGKKIALFGTCGMGNDPAYYQKVIDRVRHGFRKIMNIWMHFSARVRCRFRCADATRKWQRADKIPNRFRL